MNRPTPWMEEEIGERERNGKEEEDEDILVRKI